MLCQFCQHDNPDDASFCGECGQRLYFPAPPAPPADILSPAPPEESTAPPLSQDPRSLQADPPVHAPHYAQYGNTSGLGPQAILPEEANGWSFAGCVPFGMFAFSNNLAGWGTFGCFSHILLFLYPVYFLVIGFSGKQMAWKNRGFKDLEEYKRSMQSWNIAGLVCGGLSLLWWFAMMMFADS